MTTHLRARAAQAVGFLALVVGGIAVAPAIALAATPPTVVVTGEQPNNVLSGGTVAISYRVTNNNPAGGIGGGNDKDSTVQIDFSGAQCAANDCGQNLQIQPGATQNFTSHVKMPQVGAGQTQQVTVSITATSNGAKSSPGQATITVTGPDKPQSVRAITGKVTDTGGKGISGARIGAQDSSGKTFQAVSNGSGSFSILSSDSNPIAPGNITVGAGKDGFGDNSVVNVTGEAGKTVKVTLVLKATTASASSSPSASPSVSAGSSLDPGSVLDTGAPAGPQVNLPSSDTKNASQDSGSGSMLFVVLGALLVAAGIGAIVLVLMRRRNAGKAADGGPDGGDPTAMGGGPGVVPPSQGRFNDATRVGGAPIGGMGNPAAATMVAPRSGAPSMADAPTMLHRPVPPVAPEDEFPDPYGVPLPPQGSYAGAAPGGWDDQGANQYGAPNQYGPDGDDYAGTGQYGAGNAQYGGGQYGAGNAGAGQERFDEHTGLYQPEPEPDGYGQPGYGGNAGGGQYGAGAYGGGAYGGGRQDDDYGAAGGYQSGGGYVPEQPDQGGYGTWGAPAGGVDSGTGYAPQGGPAAQPGGGGQYGGTYGGAANGAAGGGGGGGGQYGGGQYGGGAGGGYDERGGYDQAYDQPQAPPPGGQYGGGQPGGTGRPPQQQGGGYGYDQQQYDEDNGGYAGRRGYEDDPDQPSRRGGRRPGSY
ncbi:carboxypeptidase regulatory-like domain-containing protein [Actinoplanes sp. NPDC051343]|uniref:carboxypeptidase regulatory-like domain-containing protein n=1 Tax=Actinoplanes sp. NPDC051343 TaxID=3363906 RepID=UPI0037AA268C